MDLREFVSMTLQDIVKGIQEAQKVEGVGGCIAPSGIGGHNFSSSSDISHNGRIVSTVVRFDVALTVEKSETSGGKGGVSIAVLSAGLGAQVSSKNSAASRIQFAVPVVLPTNKRSWHNEGG
mgnify:CR=1 FL=1